MKMNRKKSIIVLAIALLALAMAPNVWASELKQSHIDLTPTKAHPGASGTAVIDDSNIVIYARGLKPESVYTAWFVNMKPEKDETGAGMPPYMFKTDDKGNATYTSAMKESPFGKWKMLMIVLHPTGDPKDMKNMVGALKGSL